MAQCGSRRCGDSVHVRGWSLLRSKKGLQTLTMCGVLASSLIVDKHTYQQCEIVKMGPTFPEAHMAMCAATLGSGVCVCVSYCVQYVLCMRWAMCVEFHQPISGVLFIAASRLMSSKNFACIIVLSYSQPNSIIQQH